MKTIYEIFIISIVGVMIFSGVAGINEYMFLKGNLDEESENLVNKYDNNLNSLMLKYNESYGATYGNSTEINKIEVEADVNTLDAFVKEYGEAKQKLSIFRRGLDMINLIPDMVLLSVPFVEEEDLTFYKQLIFFTILMIIGVAIIRALFQRRVAN